MTCDKLNPVNFDKGEPTICRTEKHSVLHVNYWMTGEQLCLLKVGELAIKVGLKNKILFLPINYADQQCVKHNKTL